MSAPTRLECPRHNTVGAERIKLAPEDAVRSGLRALAVARVAERPMNAVPRYLTVRQFTRHCIQLPTKINVTAGPIKAAITSGLSLPPQANISAAMGAP